MKTLFVFVFFTWFSLGSGWTTDLSKAQTEAVASNKLILLNFSGSDWCGPCIKLKKEVLHTENFVKYAENCLVLVNADFPRQKKNQLQPSLKEANEKLAAKYNPKGKFPLTLLLNAKGEVILEWEGYPKTLNEASLTAEITKHLPK
jgi:thioredoxin-related protein